MQITPRVFGVLDHNRLHTHTHISRACLSIPFLLVTHTLILSLTSPPLSIFARCGVDRAGQAHGGGSRHPIIGADVTAETLRVGAVEESLQDANGQWPITSLKCG